VWFPPFTAPASVTSHSGPGGVLGRWWVQGRRPPSLVLAFPFGVAALALVVVGVWCPRCDGRWSFAFAPALLASSAAVGGGASRGGVSTRSKTRARDARVGAARGRHWGVEGLEGPRGVCFACIAFLPLFLVGGMA
jgi:hypothetical protein